MEKPPFSQSPVELVRYIFEIAGKNDKATAANLVRVSKVVRAWIDPVLYNTVILKDSRASEQFEHAMRTKPKEFLTCHVQYFRAESIPDVQLLTKTCRSIQKLHLCSHDIYKVESGLGRRHSFSPLHITIEGLLRYAIFGSAMGVAFKSVTHLHFPDDVPTYLPSNTTRFLPNLTHFSCCYRRIPSAQYQHLDKCLQNVLSSSKVRVVVVRLHKDCGEFTRDEMDAILAHVPEKLDPRVRLISGGPHTRGAFQEGGEDIWDLAEKQNSQTKEQ